MLVIPDKKSKAEPILDNPKSDQPPAYDALSIHDSTGYDVGRPTCEPVFSDPVAGSSSDPTHSHSESHFLPGPNVDKSLPPLPPLPDNTDTQSSSTTASSLLTPNSRAKNPSWRSFLPFTSSSSAKRVRQSVLSTITDLVVPPSRTSDVELKNVDEAFASVAEACAEYKLALSGVLQEAFIGGHTPMYWAVVNYRPELLVALLVHARPLTAQAISDIRRACLVSSNQTLFHALRVCRPPFHTTDGIQIPSLRTASDNLLVGNRPLDEIHVRQMSDEAFIVSFDIPLWQKRIKAIGQVSIEFIACSRMWSVNFVFTDPPSSASGKPKKRKNTWHVMIGLLESSLPTFFNSELVIDLLPPVISPSSPIHRLREAQSTMFLPSCDKVHQSRTLMYDHNYHRNANLKSSRSHDALHLDDEDRFSSSSSSNLPPPTHSLQGSSSSSVQSISAPITIQLGCGERKLGRRPDAKEPMEAPATKPETWSDRGVGYINSAIASLGDDLAYPLLSDHSQYLLPDGTLRGRLEARLVKIESSKDCIIC